jgi:mannose-1-phosphate guanylyltransferase/phosphomannomutase
MRGLAERFGGDPDAILTEGVRLSVDGGWVLMLPDPDNPVFYVYAEPGNGGDPHALAGEYVDLVRSLIEEGAASETSS